jgi:DNA polymerase
VKRVAIEPTFEAWQAAARALVQEDVAPSEVIWRESVEPAQLTLAAAEPAHPPATTDVAPESVRVPRRFVELARRVARHRDPERWRLLYGVLWRLVHDRRDLLEQAADPDVNRLLVMEREASPSPAPRRGRAAAAEPALAEPAVRLATSAAPFVPERADVAALRVAAARCEGCDLHRSASQTVFGRGPADATVVLVGEQPGDQEDRQGAPFVGPAGEVLDRALAEAGLDRERLYVTNAVKHFKFVARGKRRIHQTPTMTEIAACRPWIEAELAAIRPGIVVCLGATAARALLGPDFRLMKERGRFVETRWAPKTLATLHPSAVLRGEDEAAQARLYAMLVEDLRRVAAVA